MSCECAWDNWPVHKKRKKYWRIKWTDFLWPLCCRGGQGEDQAHHLEDAVLRCQVYPGLQCRGGHGRHQGEGEGCGSKENGDYILVNCSDCDRRDVNVFRPQE